MKTGRLSECKKKVIKFYLPEKEAILALQAVKVFVGRVKKDKPIIRQRERSFPKIRLTDIGENCRLVRHVSPTLTYNKGIEQL